ncbi:hypothetical protein CK203_101714 [Vitis vinifera]|uniref:Uncharacterized protein n=1 Tax=Vitis vinifera TaxID=29760 RepID=A0A438DQM5_VITVI|nr:hypothetical protein CK203_101714 [Vitis vinifera]
MPKWIRDSGGRLVKCDTPQRKEFELSLNIMEATPEDQHSHQEQLVIRPYLVPLLPTFHGMESENPYAHIKEFEDVSTPRDNVWRRFHEQKSEEAMDFLSYVADVSRGWDEPTKGEVGKMKSQLNAFNAKAGMYTLKEDDDMKAKLAAMTRRLEELS